MGSTDDVDAGSATPSPSEGTEAVRWDEAWWPLWVGPWGGALAVATMSAVGRGSDADQIRVGLLVATIVMFVGLVLYGLMIRMVSRRSHPRLRRWLAVISTLVVFVGLTGFFGAFMLGAMGGRPSWLPGTLELKEFIGLGALLCFGWAPILLVVAFFAHLSGSAEDGEPVAPQRGEGT